MADCKGQDLQIEDSVDIQITSVVGGVHWNSVENQSNNISFTPHDVYNSKQSNDPNVHNNYSAFNGGLFNVKRDCPKEVTRNNLTNTTVSGLYKKSDSENLQLECIDEPNEFPHRKTPQLTPSKEPPISLIDAFVKANIVNKNFPHDAHPAKPVGTMQNNVHEAANNTTKQVPSNIGPSADEIIELSDSDDSSPAEATSRSGAIRKLSAQTLPPERGRKRKQDLGANCIRNEAPVASVADEKQQANIYTCEQNTLRNREKYVHKATNVMASSAMPFGTRKVLNFAHSNAVHLSCENSSVAQTSCSVTHHAQTHGQQVCTAHRKPTTKRTGNNVVQHSTSVDRLHVTEESGNHSNYQVHLYNGTSDNGTLDYGCDALQQFRISNFPPSTTSRPFSIVVPNTIVSGAQRPTVDTNNLTYSTATVITQSQQYNTGLPLNQNSMDSAHNENGSSLSTLSSSLTADSMTTCSSPVYVISEEEESCPSVSDAQNGNMPNQKSQNEGIQDGDTVILGGHCVQTTVGTYACRLCKKYFFYEHLLRLHFRNALAHKHERTKERKPKKRKTAKAHDVESLGQQAHCSTERFICVVCLQELPTRAMLVDHIEYVHANPQPTSKRKKTSVKKKSSQNKRV